jgi:hypothetical protein
MNHYDLFISHASEDKRSLVQPLATALETLGVGIWYDDFALEAGDSLSRSIDRGLSDSRFGLVILSPSFLKKPWPERELRGLVSKELGRDKVIIPVWYKVSRDDILAFSLPLADQVAILADNLSISEVAGEILRIVRPDLGRKFRRLLFANPGGKWMLPEQNRLDRQDSARRPTEDSGVEDQLGTPCSFRDTVPNAGGRPCGLSSRTLSRTGGGYMGSDRSGLPRLQGAAQAKRRRKDGGL